MVEKRSQKEIGNERMKMTKKKKEDGRGGRIEKNQKKRKKPQDEKDSGSNYINWEVDVYIFRI